jgi:hypothetical protein
VEIGYVVTDAAKWEVDTERDSSEFDAAYCGKMMEKAWEEVAFYFAGCTLTIANEEKVRNSDGR